MVTVRKGYPLQRVPVCASINEVSRVFGLNESQHLAFSIIGRALLDYFSCEDKWDTMSDPELAELQRLLLLYGMGGTGKSHTINAWSALATSWSRPHAIIKIAITGVAAVNIDGGTFARFVYAYTKRGMTKKTQDKHQGLRRVILDEMSLSRYHDLHILNNFGRELTGKNLLFGGLLLAFGGDFCQLPPVGGSYLFITPSFYREVNMSGHQLYRSITNDAVVVLSQVQLYF
jgi:hypothetical protein